MNFAMNARDAKVSDKACKIPLRAHISEHLVCNKGGCCRIECKALSLSYHSISDSQWGQNTSFQIFSFPTASNKQHQNSINMCTAKKTLLSHSLSKL